MAILDLKSFYFLPHFYEDKMLMITITRKIKISETKMVFFDDVRFQKPKSCDTWDLGVRNTEGQILTTALDDFISPRHSKMKSRDSG